LRGGKQMSDIRLQDYITKIKGMIREVRLDEAIHHCQHILRYYPKHIDTYCLLGEACLEKEMYRESIEFFQRTLSADPENLIARVGLGVIYDEQRALPEAIWQLERAFELSPGNAEVRRELQRLYAQHGGVQKTRLRLTRGALGRLYSRNGLYERAIDEFHTVLRQDADLPDIHVALAEALWRAGKKLEAVEVCLEILESLPNCLKANLILGEIWTRGGNEEAGEEKLSVAKALDPENLVAREMMGRDAPLPVEEVFIPELEAVPETYEPLVPGEVGVAALAARELIEEEEIPEAAEAWEADEGLPDWLREMGVVPEEEPSSAMEAEELGLAEVQPEEGPPAQVPEWLREVTGEEVPSAAEEPAAFEEEAEVEEVMAAEQPPSVEEVPDWLLEIEAAEAGAPSPPPEESPLVEGVLDNGDATSMLVTAGIMADEDMELDADQALTEEVPEWLQELFDEETPPTEGVAPPPSVEAMEEEAPPVVEAPPPTSAIPASLVALVEAGLLDEADIESAMAEMSAEEIEAQRAEDVPAWLQEMAGEEPVVEQMAAPPVEIEAPEEAILAIEEAPPVEEALIEEIPSFEKEPPVEVGAEWLWELAEPPEEEAVLAIEAPVEEVPPVEEVTPVVVEAPAEEIPLVEEVLPVEEAAPPFSEAPVEEVPAVEEVAPPVSEMPVEELPRVEEVMPLEVEVPVREEPPAKEGAPPISEAPPVEAVAPSVVEVPEEEIPSVEEEVIAPSRVDELLEQLKAQPRDYGARLDLAREVLAAGDTDGALTHYEKLVSARKRLPDVLGDLELLVEKDVDQARVYQLLGDIHMQQDQLDQALEMYRQARRLLTKR
jgi:tetratricopeptide (TPR) repeat protein